MTDKQIIIDGVDVSWCVYFCGGYCNENDVTYKCNLNNENCYYKQLKRLEAELEQEKALKETYLACYKAKHGDIEGALFKLKQTLTEIKEIAEKYKNLNFGEQQYCRIDILQKISEAENETTTR